MPTVVFIFGVGHSGSTALSLTLGRRSRYVSLGEIDTFLTHERVGFMADTEEDMCTCGARREDCTFWGPVISSLKADMSLSPERRYEVVFKNFEKHYGPDHILVDASKGTQALERVRSIEGVDLRVIFLVRDVRGWICSLRDRARRHGQNRLISQMKALGPVRGFKRFLASRPIVLGLLWYFENAHNQRFLNKNSIPYISLGYEEFAMNTDAALQRVDAFLGIQSEESESTEGADNHVICGNRMRLDNDNNTQIRYDNRWMRRGDWMPAWLLFPFIRRWNRLHVYADAKK